mgnify:FL=1
MVNALRMAAKASFSFLKGTEWYATDYNQYLDNGAGNPDTVAPVAAGQTSFNQLNVYGDEIKLSATPFGDLQGVAGYLASVGKIPAALVPL